MYDIHRSSVCIVGLVVLLLESPLNLTISEQSIILIFFLRSMAIIGISMIAMIGILKLVFCLKWQKEMQINRVNKKKSVNKRTNLIFNF